MPSGGGVRKRMFLVMWVILLRSVVEQVLIVASGV